MAKASSSSSKDDRLQSNKKVKSSSSSSSSPDRLRQRKLNFNKQSKIDNGQDKDKKRHALVTATPSGNTRSISSLGSMFAALQSGPPRSDVKKNDIRAAGDPDQTRTLSQELMPPPNVIPLTINKTEKLQSRSRSSSKFTLPYHRDRTQGRDQDQNQNQNQMWSEKYPPLTRADLAIHPKKTSDVYSWLKEALDGPLGIRKCRRLLVLSGPSGSGKTAMINVLKGSDELDFELLEWKEDSSLTQASASTGGLRGKSQFETMQENEFDHHNANRTSASLGWQRDHTNNGDLTSSSVIDKFDQFINAASRFSPLSLATGSTSKSRSAVSRSSANRRTSATTNPITSSASSHPRRVILLEDLPNLSHPGTYDKFQSCILNFLSHSSSSSDSNSDPSGSFLAPPLVLIISTTLPKFDDEAYLAEGGGGSTGKEEGNAANWQERKRSTRDSNNVLQREIREAKGFMQINFNPIAETYLKKGLKRILELEFEERGKEKAQNQCANNDDDDDDRRKTKSPPERPPPLELVEVLAKDSQGDIRNAINCLQFLSGMRIASDSDSESDLYSDSDLKVKKKFRNGRLGSVMFNSSSTFNGASKPPNSDASVKSKSKGKAKANANATSSKGKGQVNSTVDKRNKSKLNQQIQKQYIRLLSLVSRRESSLHLFHLIGKILYNKRRGDTGLSDDEDEERDEEEEDEQEEENDIESDFEENEGKDRHSAMRKERIKAMSKGKVTVKATENRIETDNERSSIGLDQDRPYVSDGIWSDEDVESGSENNTSRTRPKKRAKLESDPKSLSASTANVTSRRSERESEKFKRKRELREDSRDLKRWKLFQLGSYREKAGEVAEKSPVAGVTGKGNRTLKLNESGLPSHLKEWERRKSRVDVAVSFRKRSQGGKSLLLPPASHSGSMRLNRF